MARKRGRPPSRPADLVVFTAQLTPEAKAKLKALAQIKHSPAYTLLESAFWMLWEALPEDTRDAAETVANLTAAPPATKGDAGGD